MSKRALCIFFAFAPFQSHFFFHCQLIIAKSFIPWGVVSECLLPIASRPIKAMDQLVHFLAPVDTDTAVHHLLSAGKKESGADKLTQSAVMVSNDAAVCCHCRGRYSESEKTKKIKNKNKQFQSISLLIYNNRKKNDGLHGNPMKSNVLIFSLK